MALPPLGPSGREAEDAQWLELTGKSGMAINVSPVHRLRISGPGPGGFTALPKDNRPARRERRLPSLAGYRGWKLQDAKARFSDLVRRAREEGPQRVTVYGEDAVVVISAAEFARMIRPASRPSLYELLSRSPLRDVEFDLEGERSPVREIDL